MIVPEMMMTTMMRKIAMRMIQMKTSLLGNMLKVIIVEIPHPPLIATMMMKRRIMKMRMKIASHS